jgi:dimethylamine monooxygenase subunit A
MTLDFHTETFRDDFTYYNSPEAIRRFPFPFDRDEYMYSVNIETHTPGPVGSVLEFPIDVDEHYVSEMRDRAMVLAEDPLRCQSLPHMDLAGWDLLELLMTNMASDYPDHFTLEQGPGNRWHWVNRPLGIDDTFVFGDTSTLPPRPNGPGDEPMGPMEYITRQSQGDFCLLDQRDDNLWMDAGITTTQADWSLDFDIGMNFFEWHGPVPLAHEMGVFDRALKYLLNLQQSRAARRLNWTMTINPRLDTSPENYDKWGIDRSTVTLENAGEKVHLRVELQVFFRLPRSNAIVFPIRCYLISLKDLVTVPGWGQRLHRVLSTLPPELVEYKGLSRYIDVTRAWLAPYDEATVQS